MHIQTPCGWLHEVCPVGKAGCAEDGAFVCLPLLCLVVGLHAPRCPVAVWDGSCLAAICLDEATCLERPMCQDCMWPNSIHQAPCHEPFLPAICLAATCLAGMCLPISVSPWHGTNYFQPVSGCDCLYSSRV